MVDVLKSFEQVSDRLNPLVLVVPGLVMVAAGLVVWLGGLGLRRVLLAVLGAAAGWIAAMLLVGRSSITAGASALAAACIAAIFQRLFTALLLSLLSFGTAFVVLAGPGLAEFEGGLVGDPDAARSDQKLSVRDSLQIARAYGLDVVDGVRYAAGRLTAARWATLAALAAGALAFGVLLRSAGGAIACATLGTLLIFAGLLLLLIYKGSAPVGRIAGSPAFYGLVFAGMAAFGTLEQLALCRRAETRASNAKSSKPEPGNTKRSWRNR
ncbi:MAG: hypothetical protein A2Y77_11540 [Planctomycetes bacterium RBG_13_62_9]|nr:MAG: hypothetical protein A2Y77_11540 [Planctomycetes bacterium RBG_13_62_9]